MTLQKNRRAGHASRQAGLATMELLIAFAFIVLIMTGVIVVAFGNQSMSLDARLNNLALYKAEEKVENVFSDVASGDESLASAVSSVDGIFNLDAEVDTYDCFWEVTGHANWTNGISLQDIAIPNKFVNIEASEALGHDCATESDNLDWDAPKSRDITDPVHPGSQGTGIDVVHHPSAGDFAFLTTTKVGTQSTLWIVDVTDVEDPVLVGEFKGGTREDIYDVDAIVDESSGLMYAFVAASSTSQFEVIEIDPTDLSNPTLVAGLSLPGVSGPEAKGRSIYFHNDKIYIGTRRASGDEFHVYDVSSPTSPTHLGSVELNHSVRDIIVLDNYAYLATSANDCELIMIDISNPGAMTNPCPAPPIPSGATVFNASGDSDGSTVTAVKNGGRVIVYLGRAHSGGSLDFYALDATDGTNIDEVYSESLNLSPSNAEVAKIDIEGPRAFVATGDTTPSSGGSPFYVFDVSKIQDGIMTLISTCPINWSEKAADLDYFNNNVFISNESGDALRIIYPSPICS